MKPLRSKIQSECEIKKVAQYVIEKDYALSYILVGIAKQSELAQSLIFKGGTALKKIYFGDYRFSEDLDFSALNAPKDGELEELLGNAVSISNELLKNYGYFESSTADRAGPDEAQRGQEDNKSSWEFFAAER